MKILADWPCIQKWHVIQRHHRVTPMLFRCMICEHILHRSAVKLHKIAQMCAGLEMAQKMKHSPAYIASISMPQPQCTLELEHSPTEFLFYDFHISVIRKYFLHACSITPALLHHRHGVNFFKGDFFFSVAKCGATVLLYVPGLKTLPLPPWQLVTFFCTPI